MKTATCFQGSFLLPPIVPKAPNEAPTLTHTEETLAHIKSLLPHFSPLPIREIKCLWSLLTVVCSHMFILARIKALGFLHRDRDSALVGLKGQSWSDTRLGLDTRQASHPPSAHSSRWSGSRWVGKLPPLRRPGGPKIRQPQPAGGKTDPPKKENQPPPHPGLLTIQTPRLKVCLIWCCFYNASINIFCFKNCFGFLAGTCTLLISTYLKLYDQSF